MNMRIERALHEGDLVKARYLAASNRTDSDYDDEVGSQYGYVADEVRGTPIWTLHHIRNDAA